MVTAIVQRYTAVVDEWNSETYEYHDHLTIEGTLDQLNADEVIASEKLGAISSHIFIIFQMVDVKAEDRFIIDGDIYQVKNVDNPNNLNRQLEITLEYTGDSYEV